MKPSLQDSMAVFSPKGFLDNHSAEQQITLQDMQEITQNPMVTTVLISLAQVFHFNARGIQTLIGVLRQIRDRSGVEIGFCDYYDKKRFQTLKRQMDGADDLHLFETLTIARLFLGQGRRTGGSRKVLVLDHDKSQTVRIKTTLNRLGYRHELEHSEELFEKKRLNRQNYSLAIGCSRFGGQNKQVVRHEHGRFIIYDFGTSVDSHVVENFDRAYQKRLLGIGFRLFVLNCSEVRSINPHGITFILEIAQNVAERGAVIFMTGLSSGVLSMPMREQLENAGVVFYGEVWDLIEDETLLQEMVMFDGAGWRQAYPVSGVERNLPKNTSALVSAAAKTLSTLINQNIRYHEAQYGYLSFNNHSDSQYAACAISFLHTSDFEVFAVMHQHTIKQVAKILLGEEADDQYARADAMAEMLTTIAHKIRIMLSQQGSQTTNTMPKFYDTIAEVNSVTKYKKGLVVQLLIEETPAYLMVA